MGENVIFGKEFFALQFPPAQERGAMFAGEFYARRQHQVVATRWVIT
jgi:hypothetical protein